MVCKSEAYTVAFFTVRNYELVGKVLGSHETSISFHECGKRCGMDMNCQGFVNKQSKMCIFYSEICTMKRSFKSYAYIKDEIVTVNDAKCPDDDTIFARKISKYHLRLMSTYLLFRILKGPSCNR